MIPKSNKEISVLRTPEGYRVDTNPFGSLNELMETHGLTPFQIALLRNALNSMPMGVSVKVKTGRKGYVKIKKTDSVVSLDNK